MKNRFKTGYVALVILLLLGACDEKNKDVIVPLDPNDFPQVILFDEEEAGEYENSDEAGFTLKLLDRIDPEGEEPGGKVLPLTSAVTVNFEVTDIEGFDNIGDYILGIDEAVYEVDDCNDEEVSFDFNTTTGIGSVTFPAGAEEIEVVFALNEDLFDDDEVNEDDRGFKVVITGITGGNGVVANTELEFEFIVLDDEKIFAEWEMDVEDDLENFKDLFGMLDEDIADLALEDIEGIVFEFGLAGLEIKIETTEEEEDECEPGEFNNVEIEIEAEYDDLTDDDVSGEIVFIVEVEDDEGFIEEVEYEGTFEIEGGVMTLTLVVEDVERTIKLYID